MNPSSDSFGLIWIENWFRIGSDSSGINRIDFWLFFIKRDTKCFSDWFGMIRIGSDTDIGMNRNQSELRLIQTEFLNRINPNYSELGFIRIDFD